MTPSTSPEPSNPSTKARATPTRGCIVTAYRTYKGKRLGPYYFRKWRVGHKVYKQYIKAEDVERVRAACRHNKEKRKETNRLLDNFSWLGSMNERYDKGKVATPEQEAYIWRLHEEGYHISGRPPLRPRRVFGAPFFSNLLEFLPSGSEIKEIVRQKGVGALKTILEDANKKWRSAVYDQIIDRVLEEHTPQEPTRQSSHALGWMHPSY